MTGRDPRDLLRVRAGAPFPLGSTNHAAVAFRTLNRFGGNQPRRFGTIGSVGDG